MDNEELRTEEDIKIVEHLKAIYDIVKTKCSRCNSYYGCMGCTLSPGDGLMGYLRYSAEVMSIQSATARNKIKELFPDGKKSFYISKYIPSYVYCNSTVLEVLKDDITKLQVDAIVNAAGNSLLGGGGVDGAIHFAAGPELIEECRTLNGCETGKAKITKGYKLPAKYVIHTVGPRWHNSRKKEFILWGDTQEEKLLKSCYTSVLDLARENNIQTIAIPAISCGAYGFPIDKATEIALATVKEYVKKYPCFKKIIFTDKNQEVIQEYKNQLHIYTYD